MVFLMMQLIHDVLVTFIIQVEEEGNITCMEGKETIVTRRGKEFQALNKIRYQSKYLVQRMCNMLYILHNCGVTQLHNYNYICFPVSVTRQF